MNPFRDIRAAALVIVLAVAAAYANSFTGPFQLDDLGSIRDNPTIRSLGDVGQVLSPPRESGVTVNGRPLLNLSLAVNHAISGLDVWSYHAANLLIHAAAALALLGVVRRTLERLRLPAAPALPVALGSALLWALHPLQTESVTYIVQRAESLVSLFYLLTLYCFVRAASAPPGDRRWFALSTGACLAGMAAKEVMVSAPLIVLLYDRTFVAGSFRAALAARRGYYAALACSWLLLAWLVFQASGRGGTAGATEHVTSWHYLLTQCRAIVLYLRLALWPSPLVFDYGIGVERSAGAVALQGILLIALFLGTAIALWRRPVAGFLGAVFFAVLAPSSSIVPVVTQTMAEHRVYLVLAVLVVPAVVLLHRLLPRHAGWAIAALALALGIATARRNLDYGSGLRLWEDTVAKWPSSARAHNNYAASLVEAGRVEEGIRHYREAIRIRPEYLRARSNLGQLLTLQGDDAGALEQYSEIIRIHPDFEGHVAFSRMLERAGRRTDSIAHLRAALRLRPDAAEVRNSLGNALLREGQIEEAVAAYRESIAANPNDAAAHSNLGSALASMGRFDEAAAAQEQALRLNPALLNARVGLGLVRTRQGRFSEAIEHLEAVLRGNPAHAVARSMLPQALDGHAAALQRAGRAQEAAAARQRAAALRAP